MRARRLAGRSVAVIAATALATAGAMFMVAASAVAESVEKSFEEEGEHDYVVPAGVCWVTVEAFGAEGGGALDVDDDAFVPGGLGGQAEARIAVTPGETLWVNVGGEGEGAVDNVAGEGGDNGGGDGGLADPEGHQAGGGGGGASDVRQGGSGLDERVVVAGGGGGAGGGSDPSNPNESAGVGGDGGGEEGEDGQNAVEDLVTEGGEGGNESEGGDGGAGATASLNGDDGEFGEGGEGGGAAESGVDGGGGGGGGWYGGGGGGGGTDSGADETAGAGGGGGSGFGPEGTDFETGEQEDDGEVVISYDPVADACPVTAIVIEPKFTG